MMGLLYYVGGDVVKSYMNHPGTLELLNSDEKFDVCVIEIFNADAMLVRDMKFNFAITLNLFHQGIVDRFDCVLISYTTFGAVKWINDMTSK